MIYIIIELNGFRQLKKIDNIFTDKIVEYISTTFSSEECALVEGKNSVFIYSCNQFEKDLSSIFNNTINIYNYLKSVSNNLAGFNILIDFLAGEYSEDYSQILSQKIFTLNCDESLYISSEKFSLFESFGDYEQEDNFFKLIHYHESKIDNQEDIVSVLSKSSKIERYLDILTPFINSDKKGLVFYYGKNIPGISVVSYCIAGILQGKDNNVPWLYINPGNSHIIHTHPLISSMNKSFIEIVSMYLNEPELSIWNEKYHFIFNTNSIIFDEDAIILFRIYLKAYSAHMLKLLLPPVVFILNSQSFNDITLDYISNILEDLYIDFEILTVIFSQEEDLPASFHGFQGKKLKFEPWSSDSEDILQIYSPVSFYHYKMLPKMEHKILNELDYTKYMIKNLGHSLTHFLLIYSLFYDLCTKDEMILYLSTDQSDIFRHEKYFNDLVLNGFIFPDNKAEPIFKNIFDLLNYNFNSEDEILIERIINRVIDDSKGFKVTIFEKISAIYKKLKQPVKEAFYLLKVIDLLIIKGSTEIAGPFFKRIAEILRMNIHDKDIIDLRQNIFFLKAAIYDNKDDFASDIYMKLNEKVIDNTSLNSERLMACSEYLFANYKYKKSLDIAKLALIDIQDSENLKLKTRVNVNLARILMGMKRIDESKDYFKIAKETVDRSKDLYTLVEINTHEAVVNFIYGNFSESLRLVKDSLSICKITGRRDWELFIVFLNGRILFELGDYSAAVVKFSEGLRLCDIYFDNKKKNLFNIWLARSFIYLKDISYGLKILSNFESYSEALYFYAEGLFFLKEFNNAFEKINMAYSLERDRNRFFCSSNIIFWESGYDLIEDRSLVVEGGYGVLFQLIKAFRAFILAKTKNENDGRIELARLTREDSLSEIDLNNGFYYYLHSLTLPEHTGAEAVDRLTLLSKALRHIQKTASNIDNPKHRQLYLSRNYWNSGLMEEGRAHKLI